MSDAFERGWRNFWGSLPIAIIIAIYMLAKQNCGDPEDQKPLKHSKDVVAIGWINPDRVSLSTNNVSSTILDYFPKNGVIAGTIQKRFTAMYIGGLAYLPAVFHPTHPRLLNREEKKYILNWMFKFGANHEPPYAFASEETLAIFANDRTNYKLLNRFRVSYLTGTDSKQVIKDSAQVVESEAIIGITTDPVFHESWPGEAGPLNGRQSLQLPFYSQVNEGTPDSTAVRAFNNLVGTGRRWNHIGSEIQHKIAIDKSYSVNTQVYPTYYIYERESNNGAFKRVRVIQQATEPSMNFNKNPYPPGPAPFVSEQLQKELSDQ